MTAPALPLPTHLTAESNSLPSDHRVLSAQFGNAFQQVAKDGFNDIIEHWELYYHPMEGSELTTVLNFLNSVGTTVWFTWTPFGEVTSKKWRIDNKSIKKPMFNFTKMRISFTITQVFDLGT